MVTSGTTSVWREEAGTRGSRGVRVTIPSFDGQHRRLAEGEEERCRRVSTIYDRSQRNEKARSLNIISSSQKQFHLDTLRRPRRFSWPSTVYPRDVPKDPHLE